jgi:large subunit ribosomal protein L3
MTQLFTESGTQVPVSILQIEEGFVLENKNVTEHGYCAVKMGCQPVSHSRVNNCSRGYFNKLNAPSFRITKEFRVSEDCLLEKGMFLNVDHFSEGQFVDVASVSKGKGFAGAIKRHGFHGLRATHGVSLSHRSHGSTGNREDPGKVFKNKKMAGHLGHSRVTVLNLLVFRIDLSRNLLFVRGGVPGPKGGVVYIRDAIKAKGV